MPAAELSSSRDPRAGHCPPVALISAALALIMLLAGCATTPPPRTLLSVDQQESLLQALPAFSMDGRAAARVGREGPPPFSVSWRQQGEETLMRFSGPFGAGGLGVTWRPGLLRLTGSRGEQFEDAEAEAVLMRELGFVPPFEALRYWMLGLPAPGEAPAQQTAPAGEGRRGELVQQGWRISYDRWMNVGASAGGVQLPRRLTATRDDLWLRVTVEEWKL
jgi:outer membrane lipoprotein LolB